MTSPHSSTDSSSTSSSAQSPPPADAEYVESAQPPARTTNRGIIFTSTLPQSHKRRPHPSQLHLKPIIIPHSPPTDPVNDTPIPVTARSIPRTQPSTALPPSLHRTATTTLMVVVGLGLLCAFGGVQLFQLSKDEKARTRMERARRKTISYLDETIGGRRQMEDEADRSERRRQDELDRAEREREKKEREAEVKKKAAAGSGWRRYVSVWAQGKG